jgi:hypothetical protein
MPIEENVYDSMLVPVNAKILGEASFGLIADLQSLSMADLQICKLIPGP